MSVLSALCTNLAEARRPSPNPVIAKASLRSATQSRQGPSCANPNPFFGVQGLHKTSVVGRNLAVRKPCTDGGACGGDRLTRRLLAFRSDALRPSPEWRAPSGPGLRCWLRASSRSRDERPERAASRFRPARGRPRGSPPQVDPLARSAPRHAPHPIDASRFPYPEGISCRGPSRVFDARREEPRERLDVSVGREERRCYSIVVDDHVAIPREFDGR